MTTVEAPDVEPGIMIATPMYGGACSGLYVQGLLLTLSRMRELGVPIKWNTIMNESLIPRARDELVRVFLDESKFEYLMFIDADIGFGAHDIEHLLAADEDIVVGLYPKKEIDWKQIEAAALAGKENLEDFGGAFAFNLEEEQKTDERGLIEVRHGATGFMLINRRVFEKLKPHVPTYRTSTVRKAGGEYTRPLIHQFFGMSIDEGGCLLSEDYHFCDLWRKHGGKIYANPFLKLSHIGSYIFSGNLLRSGGNVK